MSADLIVKVIWISLQIQLNPTNFTKIFYWFLQCSSGIFVEFRCNLLIMSYLAEVSWAPEILFSWILQKQFSGNSAATFSIVIFSWFHKVHSNFQYSCWSFRRVLVLCSRKPILMTIHWTKFFRVAHKQLGYPWNYMYIFCPWTKWIHFLHYAIAINFQIPQTSA